MPEHRFKKLKLGVENHLDGTIGFDAQFWGDYIYAIQSDEKPTVSVFDIMDKSNATQIHTKMKISRNYDTFCPAQCGVGAGKNPRIYFGGTASTNMGRRTHSFVVPATSGLPFGVFAYYIGGTSGQSAYGYDSVIAFRSSTDDIYGYTVGNPILFNKSGALTGVVEAPDLQIYLVYSTVDKSYYWCVRSVMNDFYDSWVAEYGFKVDSEDDDIGEEEGGDSVIDFPNVDPNYAIASGMMKLYRMELSDCTDLASDMWNESTWSQLEHWFGNNPPYEAIVSLGTLPYCPDSKATLSWGNRVTITLAGQSLPTAHGYPITHPVYYITFPATPIPTAFDGSFLDYEPYTTVQAYLPFIGWVNLPSQFVVGHTITIRYYIDALSGGLNAFIKNESVGVFAMHSSTCMYTIPTSSADGGRLLDGIMNAATAGISMASGSSITTTKTTTIGYNEDGGVAYTKNSDSNTRSVPKVGNALETAQHAFDATVTLKGSSAGNMGWCASSNIGIYVHRPKVLDRVGFASVIGLPTSENLALSQCRGFTQVENINLAGIPATKGEIEEFETMLKSGIVIPSSIVQPSLSTPTANRITLDIFKRTGCIHELNTNGSNTAVFRGITGAFRQGDNPSITNPSIIINKSFSDVALANYVHIAEFNRFYYIENMIALTAETTMLVLSVDVLNSFWDNAKNCQAYIARQEDSNHYRKEMIDNHVVTGCLDGSTVDTYEIVNPYPNAKQYVVACAGS